MQKESNSLYSVFQGRLCIDHTWDGKCLAEHDQAVLDIRFEAAGLYLEVVSPFYGDSSPHQEPGSTECLWDYEVVEWFLLGDDLKYLEVELGPHGHYLVLELQGVRQVIRQGLPIQYESRIEGSTWKGRALIPSSYVPPGELRVNAYAIHGPVTDRSYFAAVPVPGERPDFHRLERFRLLGELS